MKRFLLVAILLFAIPSVASAVDYVTRAKTIVANVKSKDATVPSNAFLKTLSDAFVRWFPSQWSQLLVRKGLATNPATTDPFDVGVLAGDPAVFTPSTAAEKSALKSVHFISMVRVFCQQVVINDKKNNSGTAVVGDAGLTPTQVRSRIEADAKAETMTQLGDPDNDPEN